MERPFGISGLVQSLAELFNRPAPVVVKTRHLMAEYRVRNTKDLPRSKRAEVLTSLLEDRQKRVGHPYDGDDFATLDLWMAMNAKFGSDAVVDVARLGLVTKRFIISSTPIDRHETELSEDQIFEAHLNWLEENAKRLGWKQDDVVQPKKA